MNKNEIYIKSGTQYKEMTKELLAQCDLVSQITDKKIKIGIKPNLVSPSEASWGATTHPEIVAGIIEYLQENGYENIAILEGSWVGDKTKESYEVCGYQELSEKYQVPFWDMQEDKGIEYDCKGVKLNVCERVENIDFLINVPVLKGHCQTKITCALKNMKGLIPNTEKRRFHAMGLHKPIAHLNAGIHQDFIVVDNICGDLDFEDGGNPVVMNRIWAGMDPVLIDSYVCQVMHYETKDVPYIGLAEELGVGSTDLKNAQKENIPFDVLAKVDEKRGSQWRFPIDHELQMDSDFHFVPMNDVLFDLQRKIILDAAEKEDCVIVGRCANYILDDKCLSIFIHAPFDYRVQTIIERTGREEKSAQKLVKKVDKERRTYYEYFTDRKWKDISQYHLAFDSSKFDQDTIVKMIKMAL